MKLYIDQGNTRIKLWLISAGRIHAETVCARAEEAAAWLAARGCGGVDVRLASVASTSAQDDLASALAPMAATLTFARVDPARLPTAYAEPARLGVDRWLAVLAAADEPLPAVVVDAGTAFTVDVLSADGDHLGGYILPGLALQRDVLAGRTAQVRFPEPDWSSAAWGDTTAACVCHGSLLSLAALVDAAAVRLRAMAGAMPRVLLTGGDALHFLPLLPQAELHPYLVLEGLAAYFDDTQTLALWRAARVSS